MAALRSGEYAQCAGVLATTEGGSQAYCCQGVALSRYGTTLGYVVRETSGGGLRGRDPQIIGTTGSVLTAPSRFWYDMGLSDDPGTGLIACFAERDGDIPAYTDLNDFGLTFDQIADLIEWQFLSPRSGDNDE